MKRYMTPDYEMNKLEAKDVITLSAVVKQEGQLTNVTTSLNTILDQINKAMTE